MTEVIIRPGTLADAAAIAEIYNESVAVGDATMDDSPKSARDITEQMEGFERREGYLVLERDAVVLGWGLVKRYSDRAGYRFSCETAAYFRRAETGRGYGTRLKKATIARCREWGYRHLVGRVLADNHVCIDYNLRLGYEIVGRQRAVGFRNGRWLDVVLIQLVFDDDLVESPDASIPSDGRER
ncbi:GNAT family N-acetyltransferase [Paraliomyxa miuraensis]|uniref:GNAT family N-acetyltransferase n=1 Tax=Paraliomyxa miuraensis TaxID=376150 RepID=UPI00225AF1D9|nr:GNAT family N-acetyltransferase [Paraliomyxa miuraensis]MCX4243389.1 GNAT family N-acetyltransferase [Paraliomyxa miuraensis]